MTKDDTVPRAFSLLSLFFFIPFALLMHLIFGAKGDVIILAALFWTSVRVVISASFSAMDEHLPASNWPVGHPRLQLERYWNRKLGKRLAHGFAYFFWLLSYVPARSETLPIALDKYWQILTGNAGLIMILLFAVLTITLYAVRISMRRS